jgi:hypothetical protein
MSIQHAWQGQFASAFAAQTECAAFSKIADSVFGLIYGVGSLRASLLATTDMPPGQRTIIAQRASPRHHLI